MELRNFQRAAPNGEGNALARATLVFTAGAQVRRYDYWRERAYLEQLVVEDGAIRLERLQRGAPLLNDHQHYRGLEAQIGVVENPRINGGTGECDATFSRREQVAGYVQDVADGVIRGVSCGYIRHRIEMVPPEVEGGLWVYRVVDWEPMEVSLTPIPADVDSQVVRGATGGAEPDPQQQLRTFPCEFIEVRAASPASAHGGHTAATSTPGATMPQSQAAGGANAPAQDDTQQQRSAAPAQQATTQQVSDAERAAQQAEQQRSADITDLCARHNVAHLAAGLIRGGGTVDAARTAVLEELARRDAAGGGHRNVRGIQTVADETQTRMAGLQEAFLHRVDPRAELTDNGRQYRGMSLMEMGREHLERSNVDTRGMDRLTLATRILTFRSGGMLSTSDFANLLANVANKRLRAGYEENRPSYQRWARRAPDAPDFKAMSVVNLAGAPDLLQVNEHGEFKYGAMSDGKETYSMLTYGRIVSLTRQALINDDLRGFDRLVGAFGNSAARLENRTVYAILTTNAALADTGALFNSTAVTSAGGHANLAGSGGAISVTTLSAGRAAMRLQKGLQSEELNIVPSYLIVPATQEALAYQYTSANYVPATSANVNEFRAGGRTALEPIVEAILDANSTTAWYLAASAGQVDTVEYCYLQGAAGPVIESEMGFEVDGISYKCRLDFAAKAIDFRGLYKNPGA